jgi:ribonucleoside-diphosphate reductase alpha chain
VRRKLPDERRSLTHKFSIADHDGYITVGLYENGMPGEIFIRMAKEGSTISGLMDSFATAVSVALQYGVPLKDLVNKFSHLRFEPAGFTTNRDIPMAKSLVDYIFRYMATKFMDTDAQHQVGIVDRQLTLTDAVVPGGESAATGTTPAGGAAPAAPTSSTEANASGSGQSSDVDPAPADSAASRSRPEAASGAAASASGAEEGPAPVAEKSATGLLDGLKIVAQNAAAHSREERLNAGQAPVVFDTADSPACTDCGSIMVRNGSCYKCINCGATSGCS